MGIRLVEALDLPSDIIYNQFNITMKGNTDMMIENHKGLTDYSPDHISVLTRNQKVKIKGNNLLITEYDHNLIKINGFIDEVLFEE